MINWSTEELLFHLLKMTGSLSEIHGVIRRIWHSVFSTHLCEAFRDEDRREFSAPEAAICYVALGRRNKSLAQSNYAFSYQLEWLNHELTNIGGLEYTRAVTALLDVVQKELAEKAPGSRANKLGIRIEEGRVNMFVPAFDSAQWTKVDDTPAYVLRAGEKLHIKPGVYDGGLVVTAIDDVHQRYTLVKRFSDAYGQIYSLGIDGKDGESVVKALDALRAVASVFNIVFEKKAVYVGECGILNAQMCVALCVEPSLTLSPASRYSKIVTMFAAVFDALGGQPAAEAEPSEYSPNVFASDRWKTVGGV